MATTDKEEDLHLKQVETTYLSGVQGDSPGKDPNDSSLIEHPAIQAVHGVSQGPKDVSGVTAQDLSLTSQQNVTAGHGISPLVAALHDSGSTSHGKANLGQPSALDAVDTVHLSQGASGHVIPTSTSKPSVRVRMVAGQGPAGYQAESYEAMMLMQDSVNQ